MKVAFGIGLGSSVGLLGGADTAKFMELARIADGYGASPSAIAPPARRCTRTAHVVHGGENPGRMADLGLAEYAIDRFALAGTPRDWIARIEQLAERGATRLWVGVSGRNLDSQLHYLRMMGEQVMARFVG